MWSDGAAAASAGMGVPGVRTHRGRVHVIGGGGLPLCGRRVERVEARARGRWAIVVAIRVLVPVLLGCARGADREVSNAYRLSRSTWGCRTEACVAIRCWKSPGIICSPRTRCVCVAAAAQLSRPHPHVRRRRDARGVSGRPAAGRTGRPWPPPEAWARRSLLSRRRPPRQPAVVREAASSRLCWLGLWWRLVGRGCRTRPRCVRAPVGAPPPAAAAAAR